MRKINSTIIVLLIFSLPMHAQIPEEKEKRVDHYIGLQVNFLLEQIFDFHEGDSINTNPYLLTYGLFSVKGGWGVSAGVGLDLKNVKDKGFPGDVNSRQYDFNFRAGPGRMVKVGNKFEATFNADFIYNIKGSTTFSSLVTDFGAITDSTATTVKHDITGLGGGARISFIFHFTDRVMIGTEAAMNYIKSVDKKTTTFYVMHSNNLAPENTEETEITTEEADTDHLKIDAPVAIYLIIKF
jgi:hypothetical protein